LNVLGQGATSRAARLLVVLMPVSAASLIVDTLNLL
jgi:hypothetical protein